MTSLLLLAAHVLTLSHTAFVTHSISASGEFRHQHAKSGLEEAHEQHAQSSWCGAHAELRPVSELACTAAKLSPGATAAPQGPGTHVTRAEPLRAREAFRWARTSMALLRWAPKASPPALS